MHAQLTADVLRSAPDATKSAKELIVGWERSNSAVPESVKILRSITGNRADLARASVGLRIVRGLLPTVG